MIHSKDSKGFTLVEAVVVVMLIGILMLIATPIYQNSEEHFRKMTCIYNQDLINKASELWHVERGTITKPYPTDMQELVDDGYIKSIPQCSGYLFNKIDINGKTECPKPSNKHVP